MFVNDLYAISPQSTHDLQFEAGLFHEHTGKHYYALEPNYLDFIPVKMLRRMGKAVRMGTGAGLTLLKRNEKTDGIIIGSANGGLEDCVLFLNQIVDYDEGMLTPTNFVQSTPNTLAGQLSIMSNNNGYNMTHVNSSLAFENALLDGLMYFEERTTKSTLLIGAVEEISSYNYNIDFLAGYYKSEIVTNSNLFLSNTKGSVCGEGATMFIVSNDSDQALAEIADVAQITTTESDIFHDFVDTFLSKNNIKLNEKDLFIVGRSGDIRTDGWYDQFVKRYAASSHICYKNMCGEYRTSSAFATYLGVQILSGKFSQFKFVAGAIPNHVNHVLIYNHFDAERHGLILLKNMLEK